MKKTKGKYIVVAQETSDILFRTDCIDEAHKEAKSWHSATKFNGNRVPIQIREDKNDCDYAIAEYSSGEFSFGMR